MKVRGVLFFLTLLLAFVEAQANVACESLFVPSILDETVQRVNKSASLPLSDHHIVLAPEISLNAKASSYGVELLRTRSLFNTYKLDKPTLENIHHKENFILADTLVEMAQTFIKEAQVQYSMRQTTMDGVTKQVIVISPEGSHPLNKEAKILLEKYSTETIYNPYELVRAHAEAMFRNDSQMLISESMLINGSIQKDIIGKHELTHLQIRKSYKEKIPYAFHGELLAIKGRLPGSKAKYTYSKYQSFEEVDAMLNGSHTGIVELINLPKKIQKFATTEDVKVYKGMILSKLEAQMENGLLVSKRTAQIAKDNLKALDQLMEIVTIEKLKDGYWSVRWTVDRSDNISYMIEIPILTRIKKPTREDFKILLKENLEQKELIARERAKVFEIGLSSLKEIKNSTLKESLSELQELEKIFSSGQIY